jgi:cytochrome c
MKTDLRYVCKGKVASLAITALFVPALLAPMAMAGEGPSKQMGKELFESPKLGSNGKRCADCHQEGKGLKKAASYDPDDLGIIINQCIRGPLEGKGLDNSSNEMKSLIIYIRSLSGSVEGNHE